MTADERLARLERALTCVATTLGRNYPLRGPHAQAMQEIEAEVTALDDAVTSRERAEALRSELAELEAAA
jgi:hypothetical protein